MTPLAIGGIDLFLSRAFLDDQNRETMRLLASPELMHGAVEGGFQSPRQRRLWRVDGLAGRCCLLVLSPEQPDFSRLATQYGLPGAQPAWQTKPYEPLLSRLTAGQAWRFRLKANPVRSVSEGEGRGKVMAHVTTQQQKAWLMSRAQACGFDLAEDGFEVVHTQWHRFLKKQGHQVTLRTAVFEGTLTILDAEVFRQTLVQGIGRAKAYGCGLLTLASPREAGVG